MTQPVQEPSQGRTNQGLEFRTRQLFRRPGGIGMPIWTPWGYWPPMVVRTPRDFKFAKFPGGIVTVQAAKFVDGVVCTAVTGGTYDEQLCYQVAQTDQIAANAAAASVCISIPVDDIGLVPGRSYNVLIGLRGDTGCTGAQIEWSNTAGLPAGAAANATVPGTLVTNTIVLNAAGEWFGLYAPDFDTGAGYSRLCWWYPAGDTINIKVFRTGGAAGLNMEVDCIHFLPNDSDPSDIGPYWSFDWWDAMTGSITLGATATKVFDGSFPDQYATNVVNDTQKIFGARDPALTISASGYGALAPSGYIHSVNWQPWQDETKYGGHLYVIARAFGDTALDAPGFVSPLYCSGLMPTAPMYNRSTSLLYMSAWPTQFFSWDQIAGWMSDGTEIDPGTDNTLIANSSVRIGDIITVSDKFTEWSVYYDDYPAVAP